MAGNDKGLRQPLDTCRDTAAERSSSPMVHLGDFLRLAVQEQPQSERVDYEDS